jgi:hypothetical protein
MPARDIYHVPIKRALIKAGWDITHDPYHIEYEGDQAYIDLGAEQLFAAQNGHRKIAVEVKSFLSPSLLSDVQQAIGQYLFYQTLLIEVEPDRLIVLAISAETAAEIMVRPAALRYLQRHDVQIVVVDVDRQEVIRWKLLHE